MSKSFEALKRIRQETCPATYMQDFDKNECCDIIAQDLIDYEWLKELLRAVIKVDDSDLSHLKIKVNTCNVAVNQMNLIRLKEVLK